MSPADTSAFRCGQVPTSQIRTEEASRNERGAGGRKWEQKSIQERKKDIGRERERSKKRKQKKNRGKRMMKKNSKGEMKYR
jgi:hypothetical protein